MIAAGSISAIARQYEGHGWSLRRIVFREAASVDIAGDFEAEVETGAPVDGMWFSRPRQPGGEVWELRYLGPTQFALIEHLDETEPDFRARLRSVEKRLAAIVAAREST